MDPKACYELMINAFSDGDIEEAYEHACNLRDWLDRGGFDLGNRRTYWTAIEEVFDRAAKEDVIRA